MNQIFQPAEIATLQLRMRELRASRHLTLLDVEKKSQGLVSAVALGSYERGDRAISVAKLIEVASVYQIPVTEFFEERKTHIGLTRITFDLRKIIQSNDPKVLVVLNALREITSRRGDWNGEVISLRNSDLDTLLIFSGLSSHDLTQIVKNFSISRSK